MENNRATHTHTRKQTQSGINIKMLEMGKRFSIYLPYSLRVLQGAGGTWPWLQNDTHGLAFPSTCTHITSANMHTWGHAYTHTHTHAHTSFWATEPPSDQPPLVVWSDPVEASFPQLGRTLSEIIPHCTRFSLSSACLTVGDCLGWFLSLFHLALFSFLAQSASHIDLS